MEIKRKAQLIFWKKIQKWIKGVVNPNNNNITNMLEIWFDSTKYEEDALEVMNQDKCCNEKGCEYFDIEYRKIRAEVAQMINQLKGGN